MARNMIVRLGVDASDFLKKMVRAGASAESVGQRIRKSLTLDQRSSLTTQYNNLVKSRDTIEKAIRGQNINLSRPLSRQIDDAEKSYYDLLNEAQKTKDALRAAFDATGAKGSPERISSLRRDLYLLRESAREAGMELDNLKQIASNIGSENMNFASHVGMKRLESDIEAIERTLNETGDGAQHTESFISRVTRALQNMGNSGRQVSMVPGFIRRIGDNADNANRRLERMVRTIRNVSVVSFGLRIAKGLFGEFSTVVRNYISQDAQLQAQVSGLSASLGQTLAPAIGIVTNALSYLLPYVVGVSNAFSSLMGALFGTGWSVATTGANKTAAATGGAAKAQKELNKQLLSFDQINRMDGQKDSGGGGGGAGSAVAAIESKTPAWMERFKASFSELFNSSEFQSANIGGKLGMALQAGVDWLGSEGAAFDWSGVGTKLRKNFDGFISTGWCESLFYTLGVYLGGFADLVLGFLGPQWSELKIAYQNEGWQGATLYILGMAAGLSGNVLSGLFTRVLAPFFSGIGDYFREHGEYSIAGFFDGCAQAMTNAGAWIKENITDPLVNYVKNLLGIHSPSTVFADIGGNCMVGLGNGFSGGVAGVLQKLTDLRDRVLDVAARLKEAFSFEWRMPHLRLPHLSVQWDPVDNVLANFFGVTAFPRLNVSWYAKGFITNGTSIWNGIGIGERGREALLPLDSNDGWKDEIAHRIAMILQENNGGDVNAVINLILDGDVLTNYFVKRLRRRARAGTASF